MQEALLALEDGSLFFGKAIGAVGETVGEVVFNTSMTGYQEILTDPSYAKQIVTLTYPHIGNVGVNSKDEESSQMHVAGLVIRDLSMTVSNWRQEGSLQDALLKNNIIGISDIDTRRLTRILRDKGAQRGCITTNVNEPKKAIIAAADSPSLLGLDLAKEVSITEPLVWHTERDAKSVVAYDFGVKQHMLQLLADRGCKITLVPAQTPAEDVFALQADGVLLSNGPGDPAACGYAIDAIKILLSRDMPMFGICLGFQLLALAAGARTSKMKFGHHGANHPVLNIKTKQVQITSQNHGFCVDEDSLPGELEVTHRSLFDNTLQGFKFKNKPVFGFQGHPEASPGPQDLFGLFDEFIALL